MSNLQNDHYYETIRDYRSFYGSRSYQNELRATFLSLVDNYPQYYSIDDYFDACERAGIPVV